MSMDTSILEDIGLTNAEIKVYLALLELGSSTAGPVIVKSGLQNSVVHNAFHSLSAKGLVSFIIKGKTHHYMASDPKNMMTFLDEKKRRLAEIMPQLTSKQHVSRREQAEIFEGFKGFKNMLYDVINDGKKGDEYLFFCFNPEHPENFDNMFSFYEAFEKERLRRGLIVKGIAPTRLKEKLKNRKCIIFVDFPIPEESITIFHDKVILTPPWEHGEKQISFLITSKQLANSFRKYFYTIWDKHAKQKPAVK